MQTTNSPEKKPYHGRNEQVRQADENECLLSTPPYSFPFPKSTWALTQLWEEHLQTKTFYRKAIDCAGSSDIPKP